MLEPQSYTTGLRGTSITPKTSQLPPNLLAYSYNSRIVHVTPAKDYDVCSFFLSVTPRCGC